ncbi:MAG TPA: hypothetical protein VE890_08230, partial [Thermoguttaceae bacterium]|nr:hypothetical protein [Thermoguttaceae bacterium]
MTRPCLCLAMIVAVVGLNAPKANAWWRLGHQQITEGAVSHLPGDLQAFFQSNLDAITHYSGDEPANPPAHWIDIDMYPAWPAVPILRDRIQANDTYGSELMEAAGMAPWAVADHTAELSARMSAAATAQDWQDLLVTAGELAHYIEDLHNPLHLTKNYNGQETGNDGIHARYEGFMVYDYMDQLAILPTPVATGHTDMLDAIFDSIEGVGEEEGNWRYVEEIMHADDIARAIDPSYGPDYYASLWAGTNDFTPELFQDASEMIAVAWNTAWIDAGSPTPVPEP